MFRPEDMYIFVVLKKELLKIGDVIIRITIEDKLHFC